MRKKKTTACKFKKWSEKRIQSNFMLVKDKDISNWDITYQLVKKIKNSQILEQVGRIGLDGNCICESEINKKIRGRGIGKWFYEQVLLDNKKLITDPGSTSTEARRVHRSLMKKWEHKIDVYGDEEKEGNIIYYPRLLKKK